mgnify:CR=1 FL=1
MPIKFDKELEDIDIDKTYENLREGKTDENNQPEYRKINKFYYIL